MEITGLIYIGFWLCIFVFSRACHGGIRTITSFGCCIFGILLGIAFINGSLVMDAYLGLVIVVMSCGIAILGVMETL